MNYIKIKRDDGYCRVPYIKREDGWYINSKRIDDSDGFEKFAVAAATEVDIRQLLKKEYDTRY